MNFTHFYMRLMGGDTSVFADYSPRHPFFNNAFYYSSGQVVNLVRDLCIQGNKFALLQITQKSYTDGQFCYPFINHPKALYEALIQSCYLDDLFFLQHLIFIGAPKKFLLHSVAHKNQQRLLLVLRLKLDIDIDESDRYGMTPLMFAAKFGYVDAVKELLKQGANPKKLTYTYSMTAYDFAIAHQNIECAKLLKPLTEDSKVDISQITILKKIAAFLRLKMVNDPKHYPEDITKERIGKFERSMGICSGLSAVFSMKHRQGKSHIFIKDLETICSWDEKAINQSIEDIFSDIIQAALCMQSTRETGSKFSKQNWDELYSLICPFDVKNEINFGIPSYDIEYLKQLFKAIDYDKRIIRVNSNNHAISLAKEGDNYIVYDPNSKFGPRIFENEEDLIYFMHVAFQNGKSFRIRIFSLERDMLSPSASLIKYSNIASNAFYSQGLYSVYQLLNSSYGTEKFTKYLDEIPNTILLLCALSNDIHAIKDIIRFKHLVDMRLHGNQASLIAAILFSSPEVATLLLDNFTYSRHYLVSAAFHALQQGAFHLFPRFAARGLKLDMQKLYTRDIGESICTLGSYEDFRMIVGLGYRPDPNNTNMLFNAYSNSGIDFVCSLIAEGHINLNVIKPPLSISFPDYLLQNARLSDFKKLLPYGAKPNTIDIYSSDFICNIYINDGLSGIHKLEELFPDLDIRLSPRLMFLAATHKDKKALEYFNVKRIDPLFIYRNLIYLYNEFGIDVIKTIKAANAIYFSKIQQDIIFHAIYSENFSDANLFIKYGAKINKFSLNSCFDILVENKCFTLLQKLADLATAQNISVISNCRIIFLLLRENELTLLQHLLKTNIFRGNQRKILTPVFKNSTKGGFYKTINLLFRVMPKRDIQPILDEMLVFSIEIRNRSMILLYLRLGANPMQMLPKEEGDSISLAEFASSKFKEEEKDIISKHIELLEHNPFLSQSCMVVKHFTRSPMIATKKISYGTPPPPCQ